MNPSRLELRRATKIYQTNGQKLEALHDVSLTLESGTVTAVVGRSGCGKTTLLNLAGAMDFPTSGEVVINGRATSSLSEEELTALRRTRIGFVFQFYNLIPSLTARENVALVTDIASKPMNPSDALAASGRSIERQSGVECLRVDCRHLPHHRSRGCVS